MTIWTAVEDLAAALTAAGLRATVDPTQAHAPVVLVEPESVDDGTGGGCVLVNVACRVRAGSYGVEALRWSWGTAVPAIVAAAGFDTITRETDETGGPEVVVRTQVKADPPPPPTPAP